MPVPPRLIAVAAAALLGFTARAQELVENGAFDSGLGDWEVSGAVFGSSGIAVVTDENAPASLLYQLVAADDGEFRIGFDFRNALSSEVPAGRVADSFFATLYFTDDPATFDISTGSYDRAIGLFDLDSQGPFNVNGAVGPSSKGTAWSLFTLTFSNTHAFVVPALELRDLNFVNDDSAVAIDNVSIQIPELNPGALLAAGAALIGAVRRRSRREVAASSP